MYAESQPTLSAGSRPTAIEPALESLLSQSTLRVEVIAEPTHCGSWFAEAPRSSHGLFHLVGIGRCRVESDALEQALELEAGDLVVFTRGDAHRLCASADDGMNRGDATSLICGALHFIGAPQHPLNHALPACLVIRAAQANSTFRQLSEMMVAASASGQPGRQLLLNKLADMLFTLAVCDYAQQSDERRGLFASLGDPRIAKVLHAVHESPGLTWTMQSMAALACMSRSAFAERFTQLMSVPPIQYVTQWRVSLAGQLLRDRQHSVASIAQQLGYSSEAAFRRLFKRVSGVCPGRVRARHSALHAVN